MFDSRYRTQKERKAAKPTFQSKRSTLKLKNLKLIRKQITLFFI
uniref:Uncharacterized protein n=1 Tax=Heterorhabditis bacteriophora TaxID=37862 RepID=A0A1I7WXY8_HETBA